MFKILNYKNDIFNKLIFIYIILDFLLTYFGINYIGCIEEANPIMAWLFNIPFAQAFIIRIIIAAIIYFMCRFIQCNAVITYKKFIVFAFIAEIHIILLHARWIILYFS